MKLKIGDKVPEFEMYTTDKKLITDKDLLGKKTLLLFFPAAFTSTCTKELCSVRDDIGRYNNLNVDVMGISADTVYSLIKYRDEQSLNFPLASDFNKVVAAKFDSVYEVFAFGAKGIPKRSAFFVDEKGIIQYEEVLEDAGKIPDFDAIYEVIK